MNVTVQAAKIPLELNQPVTGTVKFVSYYPDKPSTTEEGKVMPASWCLTGTFDWVDADELHQRADGKLYITEFQMDNTPTQLGLAVEDGKWPDGNVKYKWNYGQAVRIVKRKVDKTSKKLQVTISRLTELPTASGAAPTLPAASPSKGSAIPVSATVAPVAVPPSDEQWDALARQYEKAADIAGKAWDRLTRGAAVDWSRPEAMVAAAATVFIEANKRGLTVPAPHVPSTAEQKATAIRDAIDKYADKPLPIQKGEEEDDLPF
jgi:hypothetical protein